MSDQEKEMARSALKFQEVGVVTVASVGNMMQNTMTVQFRDDFDKSNLLGSHLAPCLRLITTMKITKVNRIDSAQGGTSIKWNASVAYVLYEVTLNPVADRYLQLLGHSNISGKLKGAFLFRQDPFSRQWRLVVQDVTRESTNDFQLRNVAKALRAD